MDEINGLWSMRMIKHNGENGKPSAVHVRTCRSTTLMAVELSRRIAPVTAFEVSRLVFSRRNVSYSLDVSFRPFGPPVTSVRDTASD